MIIFMKKYVLEIDGMMCGHCEAHINDAVRNNFKVSKVQSSASKNRCVIIAQELDEQKLAKVIADTGYELKGISSEPYEKKGLFSRLR